jgi:hypothetical protein
MKTYEVELRRVSYIIVTVDADDEEQAEAKAWTQIEGGRTDIYDAQWDVESIEEVTSKGESK